MTDLPKKIIRKAVLIGPIENTWMNFNNFALGPIRTVFWEPSFKSISKLNRSTIYLTNPWNSEELNFDGIVYFRSHIDHITYKHIPKSLAERKMGQWCRSSCIYYAVYDMQHISYENFLYIWYKDNDANGSSVKKKWVKKSGSRK